MAKKRLNKNVVIGLSLVGFLIIIVTSVLMLRQLQSRDPKYYAALAERYADQGDFKTAAVFYREAWQRSQDPVHLVFQGDMQLKDGTVRDAVTSWRAALVNDPALIDAHRRQLDVLLKTAQLYRQLGTWDAVREAADAFLNCGVDLSTEDQAFAHHAQGQALVNLTQRDPNLAPAGEEALRKAAALDPANVTYPIDLARYLTARGSTDEAQRLYDELLANHVAPGADAAGIRVAQAEFWAAQQRFDEAENTLREALHLAENDAPALRDARLAYSVFLIQQWTRARRDGDEAKADRLFEQTRNLLNECVEVGADDFDPYVNLALLFRAADRNADVLSICEARLSRGFSRRGVEADRNRLQAFTLMLYGAEAAVGESIVAHQAGDQVKREEYLKKAEQWVTDARGEFPNHPRLFHDAARIKLARGLDRAALEDLRRADDAYTGFDAIDWENKIMLTRLHLKLGEAGAARTVLEGVMEPARTQRRTDPVFWSLYAQTLYETGELDRALAIAEQILATDVQHEGALRLKAAVLERQGRFEDATRIVESLTGSEIIRPLRAAQQLSLQGKAPEAVNVLREALARHPDDVNLLRALVRELSNLERTDEARAIIETALSRKPDDVTLKKLSVLTQSDLTPEQRDQALVDIIHTQPDAFERDAELIGLYWRRGQFAKALTAIESALQHLQDRDTPASQNATIEVQRALLSAKLTLAAALKDDDAAQAARDAAVRYNVDGAHGQVLVGQYRMQRQDIEGAIRALRRAVEEQPTDSKALSYLGQCLHHAGQPEEGRDLYERAIAANPREGEAHKGLAVLAKQRGDLDAYRKSLAAAEQFMVNDEWITNERRIEQEQADPSSAIARREKQLEEKPDDLSNLRRLADLSEAIGDREKADRYFERWLEGNADDKDTVVAVGAYFRRTKRLERSLALVQQYIASRQVKADRANGYILLASHYLNAGDNQAVERALLSGADIESTFEIAQSLAEFYLKKVDRADQALPWLDKAVDLARRDLPARLPRTMATRISCLLDRRVNDVDGARRSVEALLADHPDYLPGWLLKSEVHARAGEETEAVDALTTYLNRKPDDAPALYQRALHRRAQGQIGAAVEDLERLKRVHPLALDLAPRFLLASLHRLAGRRAEWVRELEQLAKEAPDSPAAIEALARAYVHENRPVDAERIVTGQINRPDGPPDARWFFLRGSIALDRNEPGQALNDFLRGAEVAAHSAESVTGVLDVYLRLHRPADGLTYFDQYAPKDSPTATLLSRHARLLAGAGREAEAIEQFRRAMAQAMKESNDAARQVAGDVRAAFESPRAIELFSAVHHDGPPNRANLRLLARLYPMTGQFVEAADAITRLLESSPNDTERAELFAELGEVQQVAGRTDEARTAYEEALKYNDRHWVALNNLAYLLSDTQGEHALARPYAERAVEIQEHPSALDTFGWIYVGLSDYSSAIAELSRAIRLNPDDPLPYYHLGEAYRRDGRSREAADILKSGLDIARTAGQSELVAQIETSLEKARSGDQAP